MNAPLYTPQILRLALGAAAHPRLSAPHATAELRTPVCGSRIVLDVTLDGAGAVDGLGFDVQACAMGQASAGLMAASARGHKAADLEAVTAALEQWLRGARADPPDWPGLDAIAPARAYPARHAAILLPFRAVAQAARRAEPFREGEI